MLHHVQAVVFILNDMHTDVIGTGFVVRFEELLGDTLTHVDYVVTAKHCVEGLGNRRYAYQRKVRQRTL